MFPVHFPLPRQAEAAARRMEAEMRRVADFGEAEWEASLSARERQKLDAMKTMDAHTQKVLDSATLEDWTEVIEVANRVAAEHIAEREARKREERERVTIAPKSTEL